jgi:DNA-binding transcriptional regulator YhcF (GntR family)
MKILEGSLAQGQRLPSVRALARRLKVHHNTVSAAYQDLETAGHVELQRGSGVFVRRAGAATLTDARGLDEMIRFALRSAYLKGYGTPEIRSAVERWLAAVPPDRMVVVDPSMEMAELLAHEIRSVLSVPVTPCTLDDLARDPAHVAGALTVVLPYHLEAVRRAAPGAAVEVVTLEVSAADRQAFQAVPAGSIVLVVSHAPTVLPFASVFLRSLRGDEVLAETRLLSAPREWKRLVKAADLVIADALSVEAVRKAAPRRVREVRVVPEAALAHLRQAITAVVPQPARPAPRARRKAARKPPAATG